MKRVRRVMAKTMLLVEVMAQYLTIINLKIRITATTTANSIAPPTPPTIPPTIAPEELDEGDTCDTREFPLVSVFSGTSVFSVAVVLGKVLKHVSPQ